MLGLVNFVKNTVVILTVDMFVPCELSWCLPAPVTLSVQHFGKTKGKISLSARYREAGIEYSRKYIVVVRCGVEVETRVYGCCEVWGGGRDQSLWLW